MSEPEPGRKPVSYTPTDGLTYDPENPVYWDRQLLQKEVTRTFEICHGCRLCFKYCEAFPSLFGFIDRDPRQMCNTSHFIESQRHKSPEKTLKI